MTDTDSEFGRSEPKRRKVRKGTQSCWECKRRKVRCIFVADTDTICKNCTRRDTACVSQEYPNEPLPITKSDKVDARLARIEQVVEHLSGSVVNTRVLEPPVEDLSTCPSILVEPLPTMCYNSGGAFGNKHEELARALTAAWPDQLHLDLICTLPVGLSAHLHSNMCASYSGFSNRPPPLPQEILRLPPPGSHPVLFARKLMTLGIFLQGVPPSSIQVSTEFGSSCRNIMHRVVDIAVRLVNTNEDLNKSVEGIECIMIEAQYQNYAGNLHKAWTALHRAITIAQMMALHRGGKSPSLRILEPTTRATFDPDQICFRLVQMDCYLSMMLGLPRTSLEARCADSKVLEGCEPVDRMQRIHCDIADRILRRKENELLETHEIDVVLQKAAAEMAPKWWLIPDIATGNMSGTAILHATLRFMDQFVHYHLLIRLHLPFMLRASTDHKYDHSKITAVNASRETLTRFAVFRTSNPAHYYCRGLDFVAFIATTVLCLAHIDSHSRGQDLAQTSCSSRSLAHNRPSDRGIMERAHEIIESMSSKGTDAVATKIARIISHLLFVETSAACGTSYSTNSSRSAEEEVECDGKLTDDGKVLHIHVPYFGTINFERRTISKSVPPAPMPRERTSSAMPAISTPLSNQPDEQNQPFLSGFCYPPTFQLNEQLNHCHTLVPPSQYVDTVGGHRSLSLGIDALESGNNYEGQHSTSVVNTIAQDAWDLQGVDVAFFDSLFRGAVASEAADVETWARWVWQE